MLLNFSVEQIFEMLVHFKMLFKNTHILPGSGVFSHIGLNSLLKVITQLHLISCVIAT